MSWICHRIARRRVTSEGMRPPRGYGFGWWDLEMQRAVCFSIPLNVLFRLWRRLWFWFMCLGFPSRVEAWEAEVYNYGFEKGREQCEKEFLGCRKLLERTSGR
jgi:hypothetical protein